MKKQLQFFKQLDLYEKIGILFCLGFLLPAIICAIDNIIKNLL